MQTLMVFAPNPTDATSFYRAIGPLQEIKLRMNNLSLLQASDVNWATLKGCNAVFLQRPFADNHLAIGQMAKENNKKVWVDYDDNLFEVPKSNRAWKIYSQEKHKANVLKLLLMADVVTVSTTALKRYFDDFQISKTERISLNKKIVVLPNAYDEDLFGHYRKEINTERKKLVCWRGSDTHQKDLLAFTAEMVRLAGKHLDWTWNMVGEPFWYTMEAFSMVPGIKPTNVIETESIDPIEFFKFIYTTQPAIQIVPLWDCIFNRCKSNIAWIEGNHAGAVCLAPDWEEWQHPGIINYKNPKDFEAHLDRMMRGQLDFKEEYAAGREYIMDNLTLKKVNRSREVILRDILE